MKALDAAYQVLVEAGVPLHVHEITRRMLEKEYWKTAGKTPAATVEAQLGVDIKRHGEASRIRRVSKRTFAATVLPPAIADSTKLPLPPVITPVKPMSFLDAAEQVLDRSGSREPMHYRAITKKAIDMGFIATAGRTPDATMYAQVWAEIQRKTRLSEQPRFVMHKGGYVSLTRWTKKGLPFQIEQHNRETRQRLRETVLKMAPAEFEALIGRLLVVIGFESVSVTPIAGDGGIDVRGVLVVGDVIRTQMAVQVKRWKGNVLAPVVQQVRGSLGTHEHGLIITTGDFSPGARVEAARPNAVPVALMNGEQLVNLLIENDIGVRRTTHDLIELDEEDKGDV